MYIIVVDDLDDGPASCFIETIETNNKGFCITGGIHFECKDALVRAKKFISRKAAVEYLTPVLNDQTRDNRNDFSIIPLEQARHSVNTEVLESYTRAMSLI